MGSAEEEEEAVAAVDQVHNCGDSNDNKQRDTDNDKIKDDDGRSALLSAARKSPSIKLQTPIVGEVSLGRSWERRWQTLAMFTCSLYFVIPSVFVMWGFTLWSLFFLGGGMKDAISIISLGKGSSAMSIGMMMALMWKTFVVIYLGFVFCLDRSPTTGSRPPLLRLTLTKWWSRSCDYLPLLLVKTADLPAGDDQRYVLGYHPHGIISVGCFGAFATNGTRTLDLTKKEEATATKESINEDHPSPSAGSKPVTRRGFSFLFPGLDRRVITLPQNFQTPFLREYFLFMGACTSAKETFRNILKKPNTAVIVVVGGAAESLESSEGSMDLILGKRRGFVREAILANASLVPVLAFGENDLYKVFDTSDKNWVRTLQDVVKATTGLGMPVFSGRSIFFKDIGIMPQRKPVVVVVGAPLPPPTLRLEGGDDGQAKAFSSFTPKIDRKTDEPLNKDGAILKEYHSKYVAALEALYHKYKDAPWNVPGQELNKPLTIVK